ncbi:MAG: hypothetical protein QOE63_260 [Acidimicrobiaceae bacterium]
MRAERRDVRRLLGELNAEQWLQQSLCAGWSVRDLVAHLVGWDDVLLYRSRREHVIALLRFAALYASSMASMNLVNRRLQRRTRHLDPTALAQRFGADDGADLRWLFDGTNPGAHLAEYVIHHQDIRWPLGLPGHAPPERLVAALHGITQLPGVRGPAWLRLRRVTLEATDVAWSRGRGPVQRMPGEAILMALAGRPG